MRSLGIYYDGLETLNIDLGVEANEFFIESTHSGVTVSVLTPAPTLSRPDHQWHNHLNTGADTNTVNVGSTAPGTDGNVNGILGHLVIHGQSSQDTLNVYDKEDGNETGNLTATDLTGLDLVSQHQLQRRYQSH